MYRERTIRRDGCPEAARAEHTILVYSRACTVQDRITGPCGGVEHRYHC